MATIPFLLNGILCFGGGGGVLSGFVKRCSFSGFSDIVPSSIPRIPYALPIAVISILNSELFPGRGNVTFLENKFTKCIINDSGGWGCYIEPNGNLQGIDASFIITKNIIKNYSKFSSFQELVLIETNCVDAIQMDIGNSGATGKLIKYIVTDNIITDPSGLAAGISLRNLGGSLTAIANIEENTIVGSSTGIEIISQNIDISTPGSPNAYVLISNNKCDNNDSAIVIAGDGNKIWNNLEIKVENNCFKNINADRYGGVILYGGWTNEKLLLSGLGGYTLAKCINVDLGGGCLNSVGNNNFIKIDGADIWIDYKLKLSAKMNCFENYPESAGPGKVCFNPVSKNCKTN
jgi:hypothetical protein